MKYWWQITGYTIGNFASLALIIFFDSTILHIIGWIYLSLSISFAGIFSVIGASHSDP